MLRIIFGPVRDETKGLTGMGEISTLSECTKPPVGPNRVYWRNEQRALGEWAEWTYWIKYVDTLNWRQWQTELSILTEWVQNTGGRNGVSWRT